MSTMDCSQFAEQLDEWLRGERSAGARVHARECHDCRSLAEDFLAIAKTAREWAIEEPEPSPRLWTSLRAQLREEGLVRDSSRQSAPLRARVQPQIQFRKPTGWVAGWFSGLLRPALAGGYLAALIAVSLLFVGPSGKQIDDSQWLERTQVSVKPLTADLNSAERAVLSNLTSTNPVLTASFHRNLAIVDKDISECEKSVHEQPENELARDFLYQAYEQKADLLADIADNTMDNQ
ncbi:MAG: hypothetical protein ACRD4R_11585 [Candidatus Acidiferrales bacterium]